MNNIKYNILICVSVVLVCTIITITNGVNFFLLLIPIIFIIAIAWFSSLLKKRFGSSYGAPVFLFLVCIVPIGWYVLSDNLPMTYLMTQDRKKSEDLLSFKKYAGGIDAKKEVADYQLRQDSVLRLTVIQLLAENLIDSALTLIRKNQIVTEKIKKGLFSTDSLAKIKTEKAINVDPVSNSSFNGYQPCGNYPESSTRYLTSRDVDGKTPRVLRLMKAEIYMRNNVIFTSQDLANYASSFDCYTPLNKDINGLLSEIELANIKLIVKRESDTGYVVPEALSLLLPIALPVSTLVTKNILILWDMYVKDKTIL